MKALLENHADPHLEDDVGAFPLHYAIDSRSRQCVRQLLCVDRSCLKVRSTPCVDEVSAMPGALLA